MFARLNAWACRHPALMAAAWSLGAWNWWNHGHQMAPFVFSLLAAGTWIERIGAATKHEADSPV